MNPNLEKRLLGEAATALQEGKTLHASSLYARLGLEFRNHGDPAKGAQWLGKAVELSPTSARLYLYLGTCEARVGNPEAAEAAILRFSSLSAQKQKLHSYWEYVENELKAEPKLRALFYESALLTDRTHAVFFLGLSKAQIALGEWTNAKTTLLSALKTKSQTSEVTAQLREVLEHFNSDQGLKFLEEFKQGILSGDELELLLVKEPLVSAAAEGAAANGKDLNALIRDLEKELGITLEERFDNVAALIREFRNKTNLVLGGDSKGRIDLALAFHEMGLQAEAREELSKVLREDAHYLEAQSILGEIWMSEGLDLNALSVYQAILRFEPLSTEVASLAHYRLIQIYLKLGDLNQAKAETLVLEKISPNYRDLRRLRVEIDARVKESK